MPVSESGNANPVWATTLFRSLIASLPFEQLNEAQLYDLNAIAAESAEGLCHGLGYLGESLENEPENVPDNLEQVSGYLKASAHVIPALLAIVEQSNERLMKMKAG